MRKQSNKHRRRMSRRFRRRSHCTHDADILRDSDCWFEIYCNAMIGLPTGYTGILRVQLQNSKDGENWETQHTWLCSDSTVSYMDRIAGLDLQYRVRVVADVSNAAGEKIKQIEKVSSCVWG